MGIGQVQKELEALAARLGRGLTIDSVDHELITHSTQRDDADRARISSILFRRVPPEVSEWEDRHLVESSEFATIPANPALGMLGRVCVRLHRHDQVLGRLWLLRSGPEIIGDDLDVLRRGADSLAALLDIPGNSPTRPSPPGRDIDRLVRQLFEGNRVDACDQLTLAVPEIVEHEIHVIAAVAAHPDGGCRSFRSSEFSSLASSLTPILHPTPGYLGCHVATNYVLVVLHHQIGHTDLQQALTAIGERLALCLATSSSPVMGISAPHPLNSSSAAEARGQALAAAELAALDPALARPSFWDTLGPYRSLTRIPQPVDDVLAPLAEAGASTSTLLETLEVYLDLGGDIQATASRLGLHRSSLYYRLNRVANLCSVDLSNGLARLELHMALKGRRVTRRALSLPLDTRTGKSEPTM